MSNKITVGLVQARKLCAAGWNTPTEFYWAYGPDRLIGKLWRVYHKSEYLHSLDPKDVIPAAPTAEELWNFIYLNDPGSKLIITNPRREKLANILAEYILKNKLLNL